MNVFSFKICSAVDNFCPVTKIKMGVFGLSNQFKNQEFSSLPFAIPLLPSEGTPSKVIGLDGWPDHQFERNIKYRVTMMESALELCRKGLCVAYLPEFVVGLHNENVRAERKLIELPCPIPNKNRMQSVFIIKSKDSRETSLHRQIAKCLRSLA